MAKEEELPTFEDGKTYVLKGSTLNKIITAIQACRIQSIEGGSIERTPKGVIIKLAGTPPTAP